MARKPRAKVKAKAKPGPRTDNADKAIILSYAATFGVKAAAAQFSVDRKTIQRYRAELASGKNPELSRLVAKETELARERSRSKIQLALDALLDRAIQLAPTADLPDVIMGLEKVGDLATTRKVLGVEGDTEGQEAPGNESLGRPRAGQEGTDESAAVH